MVDADSAFTVSTCPRCHSLTMAGHSNGLAWRLDGRVVPLEHAGVLRYYGVPVLALSRRLSGFWADPWYFDHPTPGKQLAAPHVCGSAHAKRSQEGQ